jgi:hypothetical protein
MESLALLVVMLMSLVLFTGPLSLLLTSKIFWEFTSGNKPVWIIRRVLVSIISLIGMTIELLFIMNPLPAAPKFLAMIGFVLNIFALKREFLRNKAWRSIFRPNYSDPNGPPGQR